jgi:hypothetical protein
MTGEWLERLLHTSREVQKDLAHITSIYDAEVPGHRLVLASVSELIEKLNENNFVKQLKAEKSLFNSDRGSLKRKQCDNDTSVFVAEINDINVIEVELETDKMIACKRGCGSKYGSRKAMKRHLNVCFFKAEVDSSLKDDTLEDTAVHQETTLDEISGEENKVVYVLEETSEMEAAKKETTGEMNVQKESGNKEGSEEEETAEFETAEEQSAEELTKERSSSSKRILLDCCPGPNNHFHSDTPVPELLKRKLLYLVTWSLPTMQQKMHL